MVGSCRRFLGLLTYGRKVKWISVESIDQPTPNNNMQLEGECKVGWLTHDTILHACPYCDWTCSWSDSTIRGLTKKGWPSDPMRQSIVWFRVTSHSAWAGLGCIWRASALAVDLPGGFIGGWRFCALVPVPWVWIFYPWPLIK